MSQPVDKQAIPVSPEINVYNDPRESFDAQVRFAQKWSEITGDDFAATLYSKTPLYTRISEPTPRTEDVPEDWRTLIAGLDKDSDPKEVTDYLYELYKKNPESKYTPPTHDSAIGFDYLPTKQAVKIHFTNPSRGERPLSDENMPQRQAEFRTMLEHIKALYPEAALVISGTWLRSTSHYRNLSPPDVAPERNLMSPDMKMTGNSVWGQFTNASGNINKRVYDQFIAAIEKATTVEELLDAFPYKTMLSEDSIDKYYDFYGINGESATASSPERSSETRVRDVQTGDLASLKPILEQWIKRFGSDEPLTEEISNVLAAVKASLEGENGRKYVVAEDDQGNVIGIMGMTTPSNDMQPYITSDNAVEFINAYVDKEARGTGAGKLLAKQLEEMAIQDGHTEIIVNSGPRYKDTGWAFWTKMYGEPVAMQKDLYGPGADAPVWRKSLPT